MKRRPVAKLNLLAELAGVKLNWNRSAWDAKDIYRYDGQDIACKWLSTNAIIHEIAHYVIATPKARTKINYGLGNLVGWKYISRLYNDKQSRHIEDQVIGLTFHYGRELGIPSKEMVINFATFYANGKSKPVRVPVIDEFILENKKIIARFSLEKLSYNHSDPIKTYKYLRGIK